MFAVRRLCNGSIRNLARTQVIGGICSNASADMIRSFHSSAPSFNKRDLYEVMCAFVYVCELYHIVMNYIYINVCIYV